MTIKSLGVIGSGAIAAPMLEALARNIAQPIERLSILTLPQVAEGARELASRCGSRIARHTDVFTDGDAFLAEPFDFVVDAIDNMKAKLHLLNECVKRNIPVVSCMGAAGRIDPTCIRVDDLSNTQMDPFAKDVRKLLKRKYGIDTMLPTGITTVFSIEPRRTPFDLVYDEATGGFMCVCPHGDNEFHSCEHRNQIDGSLAFVTSVFGMQMAGVVVRRIAQGR